MPNKVKITVDNPWNLVRKQDPVNCGIPVPKHERLATTHSLRLYDSQSNIVPCQVIPLAWWPGKKYIKWVLLHFQANVAPLSREYYYLDFHTVNPSLSTPQNIALELDGIEVDNQVFKCAFTYDQMPKIFDAYPKLTTADDEVLIPGNPKNISIDENGSQRSVIKLEGPYVDQKNNEADFDYLIRVEFYIGKPIIRLFNTIISKKSNNELAEAVLAIPNESPKVAIHTDTGTQVIAADLSENPEITLIHDAANQYSLINGAAVRQFDQHFQGWIHNGRLAATVRFFWQMFPKSLEADSSYLKLGLLPGKSQVKDSFKPAGQITDKYVLAEGEARTHEIMLYVNKDNTEPTEISNILACFHQPIIATAPWQWYTDSTFFGDITVRDSEEFPEFEEFIDASLQLILDRRQELDLYGDRNFGDDQLGRAGLWNNCEYDYPHVGVTQFLRGSGHKWYTHFALPAARHMMDIDLVNTGTNAGRIYPHSIRHNTVKPKLGSHSWLQGLLEYYLVSGDYRARDLAQLSGERWCNNILGNLEMEGTERGITWPLISMLSLYKVFAEPKYLKAAKKIRNTVVRLFNHELGHFEGCMKRENYPPSYWQVFLIGSPVLESLIMYNQLEKDESVKQIVVSIAKRLANINWIEDPGVWEYPKPNTLKLGIKHHTPKNDRMVSPGVGYAYFYCGDELLWQKAVRAFENRYKMLDQDGKTMTQSLRFGIRMPALMQKYNNKKR